MSEVNASESDVIDWNAARFLSAGKLVTLLHARSRGALMDENTTRVICRAAEKMLRRLSPKKADADIGGGTCGWMPIETAPRDGSMVLLYRPLAGKTQDPVVTIRRSVQHERHVWEVTIPPGCDGKNFTEGSCYATHWMPIPEAPTYG